MSNSVTPKEAQRLVRSVIRAHNAASEIAIRTRATATGLQVGLVGKGEDFFNCSTLADVQSFADGVADVEIFGDGQAPERSFETHASEAAYFFGSLRASRVGHSFRRGGDRKGGAF